MRLDAAAVHGGAAYLSYAVGTNPAPLTVSPASGGPVSGAITIVISNDSARSVNLHQIAVRFGIGAAAGDLASDAANIETSVTPSSDWTTTVTSRSTIFEVEVTPVSGPSRAVGSGSIVIHVYGIPINTETGTVDITIVETAGHGGHAPAPRTHVEQIGKFPYGFFMSNFVAQSPQIDHGETVKLTWNGAEEAKYVISYGSTAPQNVTNKRAFTSAPLTQDTVFLLHASLVVGSQTVDHYLSAAVTVSNPDIDASSLEVAGASKLNGDVTAAMAVNAATLSSSSDTSVQGALTVTGTATLPTVAATSATMTDLTIGSSSKAGALAVDGVVGMVGAPQALSGAGTYQAPTDGYVIAVVSSGAGLDTPCVGWTKLVSGAATAVATGGNDCSFFGHSGNTLFWSMSSKSDTAFLPVAKGASFTWSNTSATGSGAPAGFPAFKPANFDAWFIPVGTGAATGPTTAVKIGDDPSLDAGPELASTVFQTASGQAVTAAGDAIVQLSSDPKSTDRQTALRAALEALFGETASSDTP